MDADIVVVGGGIAGTLAVLAAGVRGLDVAWVAPPVGPDDQSAHWHGYLHRGTFFNPVTEAALIAGLQRNWPFWSSSELQPFHRTVSTFAVAPNRERAEAFAARIGSEARLGAVEWLGTRWTVPTEEAMLDGPRLLSTLRLAAASCAVTVVPARCTRITRVRPGWSVRTEAGCALTGRQLIVAAGEQTPSLVRRTQLDGAVTVRDSRMLVVRGNLPAAALTAPHPADGGIFLASRKTPRDTVWLVSDNFSTPRAAGADRFVDAWWACSAVERLARLVGTRVLDGATAGAYSARKSSLRTDDVRVPDRGAVVDGEATLVCLSPSKWSNAPTSAHHAVQLLGHAVDWGESAGLIRERLRSVARASNDVVETWETVEAWQPVEELLVPGRPALRTAGALFRPAA